MDFAILKNIVHKPISGEWGSDGGNTKVLRTTNFTNEGVIDFSDVVIRDIEERKVKSKRLYPGDIIIEKSGGSPKQPVGRVVYFESNDLFLCNNFTSVLRPKSDQVFPKYLHYLLFANHQFGFTSAFQNKTTGIINLKLTRYLEKTKIPLPPLDQQKKIAAILDAADAYRQKTKALIEKYDELTQSLFLEMFGDPVTNPKGWGKEKLVNHIELVNGRAYKRDELLDEGTPVLRIQNLNGGDRWFYSNLELPAKKYCHEGDLLFAWSASFGPYIYFGEKAIFHYHIWNCLLKPTMNKLFAYNLLLRLTESIKSASHGASMLHITKGKMEDWDIIIPSIDMQNLFANHLQAIEAQKALAQQELDKADELFNSLLQRAFKGELV